MPDSTTNVEMDDVLSSVRKMVSETGVDKSHRVPVSKVTENDRFILTPALLVGLPPNGATSIPNPALNIDEIKLSKTEHFARPDELTGVLAAAAAQTGQDEAAGEMAPELTANDPVSPQFEAMEQAWKEELAQIAATKDAATEVEPVDVDAMSDAAPSLESRIAELEEAVGHTQDEWEPDGSEPKVVQPPRHRIFEVISNANTRDSDDNDDDSSAGTPMFSHSSVPRPKPYLLSETFPPPEPEPGPTAQTGADTRLNAPVEIDHASSSVVEDDDVFLDVESLRTMISDVVKEELRGKLGESITRNVRRMMQQEISHAISQYAVEEDDDDV
ncbi:MAG: hypothetical protein V3U96_08755 [Paracoccaceae bacterium]